MPAAYLHRFPTEGVFLGVLSDRRDVKRPKFNITAPSCLYQSYTIGEEKSFGILITFKRLMQHEVMKPESYTIGVFRHRYFYATPRRIHSNRDLC
jgi:hypothetical protein